MIDAEKLANIFSGTDGIVATYFFGSQVKGKTDLFSDYDFAVLFQNGWQEKDRFFIIGELLSKAFSVVGQDKADVVDLSCAPLWFQYVVVKTGKILYEADRQERHFYERELRRKCFEAGIPEYEEDGKMKKQEVQIHLDTLGENLEKLEKLSHFSWDEFMADFWYLDAAVRRLQTSIEALVDISRYVIRSLGLPPAQEYWQVPTVLADAGHIDQKSAPIYIQMVRFRNLIVHHYYRVAPEDIYKILTENLSDIQKWRDRLLELIEVEATP